MFEKFTETALKIIMAAEKEARILNNNFVGTELFFYRHFNRVRLK